MLPLRVQLAYGAHARAGAIADDDLRLERAEAFVCAQPEAAGLSNEDVRAWALALMTSQGHPHGNPDGRRLPKTMKKKTGPRAPSREAVMSWANFVLYAVVGRMREADAIMVERRPLVLEMAAWMQKQHKVELVELHRGVLVEPQVVQGGKLPPDPRLQFISWTEDLEVACWFANPDSIISECVRGRRPHARGYVASDRARLCDVLWHHDWVDIPTEGGSSINLALFAGMHPHIDEGQFLWNVQTQSEVITLPPQAGTILVVPIEDVDCGETDELDTRFTYPIFLAGRYSL